MRTKKSASRLTALVLSPFILLHLRKGCLLGLDIMALTEKDESKTTFYGDVCTVKRFVLH